MKPHVLLFTVNDQLRRAGSEMYQPFFSLSPKPEGAKGSGAQCMNLACGEFYKMTEPGKRYLACNDLLGWKSLRPTSFLVIVLTLKSWVHTPRKDLNSRT